MTEASDVVDVLRPLIGRRAGFLRRGPGAVRCRRPGRGAGGRSAPPHRFAARSDAGLDRRPGAAVRRIAGSRPHGAARARHRRPAGTARQQPGVAALTGIKKPRRLARISHTGCACAGSRSRQGRSRAQRDVVHRLREARSSLPVPADAGFASRRSKSGKRGDAPCRLLQPALRVAFRRASPASGVSTVWPDTVFAARRRICLAERATQAHRV